MEYKQKEQTLTEPDQNEMEKVNGGSVSYAECNH